MKVEHLQVRSDRNIVYFVSIKQEAGAYHASINSIHTEVSDHDFNNVLKMIEDAISNYEDATIGSVSVALTSSDPTSQE